MFGRVPKHGASCLGTRPNIRENHSEISTRVPFCIAAGPQRRPRGLARTATAAAAAEAAPALPYGRALTSTTLGGSIEARLSLLVTAIDSELLAVHPLQYSQWFCHVSFACGM